MQDNRSGWFKSTYSAQNGDCLEARHRTDGAVDLRDSKIHGGPVLTLSADRWSVFATAVKDGALAAR
ncbi:DUF397 domain-containing protein [Streptomyces bohaiensis]|uniref:DUF397 domain-containing protein n=1 Tax=Streptomyces bohaiensis TaxID=1431344 RepID=A0ABX1CGF4_9ACTN|nr:DUF397 domain-containing protein [Streptomyces bohaiensis]NJQ16237.1 DUF397 domain-containing protein [Streptomyces bohaiensis]